MARKKSPYLTMLKESLIDFSKMTTHKGPAADVVSYDGKGEMDFYKPANDVVSILERMYIKEGIIDSDDSPVAAGGGAGRKDNADNSNWVEQDLVDIASPKASGQSGPASGGPGTLPNGEQPEGYSANAMDQDDSTDTKEQTPDYGVKPVNESIAVFDDLQSLLEGELPDVESNADTNEVAGADAAAGKPVPELGDSKEFTEDFEVPPSTSQVSQGTMQEMLDEALQDIELEALEEGDYDPFLEASELMEMEDEDSMEPSEDEVGGTPVMPAGDEDIIGNVGNEPTDLDVPPVGDQDDQIDEAPVSAQEPGDVDLEMYEADPYGEDSDMGMPSHDLAGQDAGDMMGELDGDDEMGGEGDLATSDVDEIEPEEPVEDIEEFAMLEGETSGMADGTSENVGPGPSGVESVDNEIGPDRGQGTPGAGRREETVAQADGHIGSADPSINNSRSLEEALANIDAVFEGMEVDGEQDFFQEAADSDRIDSTGNDAEPTGSEDSKASEDLFGGEDEGIPDSDKASTWAEESALFEDVSTDMTEPGKAGASMSDTGEQHRTDLGPDAGGTGDKLESLEEMGEDLFEEAMDEGVDMSSEPAKIENDSLGTLPNTEPTAGEQGPAKIENASLNAEQVNENTLIARRKSEESIVERLLREFENSSDEDIVLESADLSDEPYDDFFG